MEAPQPANLIQVPNPPAHTPRAPRASFANRGRGEARGDHGRGDRKRGNPRGGGSRPYGTRNHPSTEQAPGQDVETKPELLDTKANSAIVEGNTAAEYVNPEGLEADVCFICASPVVHNSIAPCNHRTCHICALRLRALYQTKACAHCRAHAEYVVFTDSTTKRYADCTSEDVAKTDDRLGIKYERSEIFEDTVLLLRYNCPDPSCDMACYGWPDLHKHIKNVHNKVLCDLCTTHKKVFTHEHSLYTLAQLRTHIRHGDDIPGAPPQSGFKGHPECGFCRQRFYGEDELYTHCRDRHERCHICDRRHSQSGDRWQQQYYLDYNALELHFGKEHWMCPDSECLEKKFVVFESEMDLKAHQLEAHPAGLSKDARRDARRVDMSGFDYRNSHQQERRGGNRERRNNTGDRARDGGGRGRNPNAEALPVSSAQPLRRDELAYQRQLAIRPAQSISNRTFGAQLTSSNGSDVYAARPSPSTQAPDTITAPRQPSSNTANSPLPDLDNLTVNPNDPATRARTLRHAALLERAASLSSNDPATIPRFRDFISDYKSSHLSASDFLANLFSLFPQRSTPEIGTLVKELAEIYEIPRKREALLRAWSDWRAIHDNYPSLPGGTSASNGIGAGAGGSAGSSSTGWASRIGAASSTSNTPAPQQVGGGGRRMLRLKSSMAQNSRSWSSSSTGNATPAQQPRNPQGRDAFPPMPSSATTVAAGTSKPSWVAPSNGNTANANANANARASPAPRPPPQNQSKPGKGAVIAGRDAFPALPAAAKPGMNVGARPVIRDGAFGVGRGGGQRANAWKMDGLGGAGREGEVDGVDGEEEEGVGGGKGRKGKKKQMLVRWG